jgi:1-deoxyxylulose-5-phosphate synthase
MGPVGGRQVAHFSRRDFLKTGLAAGVLAGTGRRPLRAARGTATDWVTLGVEVTRLDLRGVFQTFL